MHLPLDRILCGAVMICGLIVSFHLSGQSILKSTAHSSSKRPWESASFYVSNTVRENLLSEIKSMFYFGYNNYMKYAFPDDELDPIHCRGRGHDHDNKRNINVNDALGDYLLTLVDTLDTLVLIGNRSEFEKAVKLVIENVHFDKDNTVQVFEATIRVLGGLLSAYFLLSDEQQIFGSLFQDRSERESYARELLSLSNDLATRLMPAFQQFSGTGLPHPRVNLRHGLHKLAYASNETCVAGAGSLLLEFATLGRLLGDSTYESVAKRSLRSLWRLKSNATGLMGSNVHIHSGQWTSRMSGVGAGLDSYFEYLLKGHILLGDDVLKQMFNHYDSSLYHYGRRGPARCTESVTSMFQQHNMSHEVHKCSPFSSTPSCLVAALLINVDMLTGDMANTWIDSLQASWPGLLTLSGNVEEAICLQAVHYAIWQRFGVLPERYNWYHAQAEVNFYPLRPELVESTYLLYRATKHPFYLAVGRDLWNSLQQHTRSECGYATVHDVHDMTLEDRMESFFLSETCKYLYLLFDVDNPLHRHEENYLFTTEGHLLPVSQVRHLPTDYTVTWGQDLAPKGKPDEKKCKKKVVRQSEESESGFPPHDTPLDAPFLLRTNSSWAVRPHRDECTNVDHLRILRLPFQEKYWHDVNTFVHPQHDGA